MQSMDDMYSTELLKWDGPPQSGVFTVAAVLEGMEPGNWLMSAQPRYSARRAGIVILLYRKASSRDRFSAVAKGSADSILKTRYNYRYNTAAPKAELSYHKPQHGVLEVGTSGARR